MKEWKIFHKDDSVVGYEYTLNKFKLVILERCKKYDLDIYLKGRIEDCADYSYFLLSKEYIGTLKGAKETIFEELKKYVNSLNEDIKKNLI